MASQKIISIILFLFLLARLIYLTPSSQELFKKDYNFDNLERLYHSSQYIQEEPEGFIPDNAVYNYAAGYYLRGGSPIVVDPSQPPLGKYLLGLSILIFQNTKVMIYIFFYLSLLAFFLLGKEIFKNINLALLTTFLFSFEKIFLNQLRYVPMLDIFQLCFLLFAFYFFIKWSKDGQEKHLLFASLSLGAVAAVKFFITTVVIFISWIIFLALKKNWRQIYRLLFFIACSTYLVLTLSYLRVLIDEPNPFKVLSIQKWIYHYHRSKLTSVFTVWPLIFCNRWQAWWGEKTIIQDPQWWPGLPILFSFSFITTAFFYLKKLKDEPLEIILIWFLTYSVFISFAQANIRYLLPILPFLYLIFVKGLSFLWHEIKKQKI